MFTNNKKEFLLYGHAGSYNHGAEAITSSIINYLRQTSPGCRILLSTNFPEQDREFSIDADEFIERDIHTDTNEKIYANTISRIHKDSVCIHVGGDNYCYRNWQRYALINQKTIEKGAASILWGCSIEPNLINYEMLDALKQHTLITARENITYNTLVDNGLTNVVKTTDIAFSLPPEDVNFMVDNFVAINISPLVINENQNLLAAVNCLVDYILNQTDMNIVLIPHCLVDASNDVLALNTIITHGSKRVVLISQNLSARQYKYIISKARFGVFARTHAAIAAYSSFVPTLALGYSVKSRGIAADLGMSDYVVDIHSINASNASEYILANFMNLMKNEIAIHYSLSKQIPEYVKHIYCQEIYDIIR